jgi:para-nitrobenzyl esterase
MLRGATPVSSAPTVTLRTGQVRGVQLRAGVEAFLGIPYAAAPTGRRRWAAAEPAAPWTGVRDASTAGAVCPQPARPFSEWAHGPLPATDEDSLTVNVWRPPDAAGRPVLVFLHGGGWALGWGSNPLLDGRHLAAALDAVIVTLNYRLGSLGWLCHPALAAGPTPSPSPAGGLGAAPAGNWGLSDQLAALRWVQENIDRFGGDPMQVTLGGESAGAGSVLHLLGHPEARGLFRRAITLSPPLHELVLDSELGERWTRALTAALGLGDDVAAALSALRDLPAEAIVAAQETLLAGEFQGTRGGAMPIAEPGSLPADPARAPHVAPEIPLLIGSNAQEGTFFFRAGGRRIDPDPVRLRAMVARVAHVAPEEADGLIEAARERLHGEGVADPTGNDLLCAVVTEVWFAEPIRDYGIARAAAGATVHRYRIEHRSPDPDDLGALHSMSVPLLFGSWREGGVPRRLTGDGPRTEATTAAIQDDVRRFVHGQPLGWQPVAADGHSEEVVYGAAGEVRAVRAVVVRR